MSADERDELLERIEKRLRQAAPVIITPESNAEATRTGPLADVLRLFERARALGVVRYPRP